MDKEDVVTSQKELARIGLGALPLAIANSGRSGARRFLEFFAVTIRNKNTRLAYAQAAKQFFDWCEQRGIDTLDRIEPVVVAAYIEQHPASKPTIKQHLAAIRMLFDWMVTGQIVEHNPATSVRGPKHVVKRGKTSVLTAEEARTLLDSIETTTVIGLRDRALIGVMVYSFARVSAAVSMKVEDFYAEGKRWWLRLHEKGGKRHEVPAHHNADGYIDAYLKAAGIASDKKTPLFRSVDRKGFLTARGFTRNDALRMIKRRAAAAGLSAKTCCHSFRATGITAYLENGGTIENAQAIAAHESPRTTKLYDRTSDEITLDEIERIAI
ncbi:MAG TPA: tyrosine-type recombinase/integrase [Pirellulales bacterium]|jgi:site-specific recombinase XerD|nr:tyrosine-type recombinase/integrase [Pirellulales bacterium]